MNRWMIMVGVCLPVVALGMGAKPAREVDPVWTAEKGNYAEVSHGHDAAAITSGTLDPARLPADVSRLGPSIDGAEVEAGSLNLGHLGPGGAASNDVIRWNGAAWVPSPGTTTAPAAKAFLSLPPVAFQPMSAVSAGYGYQMNADRLMVEGQGAGNLAFAAPVHLPHGAAITDVTYSFFDNDSARRISAVVMGNVQGRVSAGWMDAFADSGSASTQSLRITRTLATPRVIDNGTRSYVMQLTIDAGAGTNLQFMGASIGYTPGP